MSAKPKNMTTIAVSKKNAKRIAEMERGFEDYDAVITRLLNNQADVNFELIMVDTELPQLHTLVFQLGDDPGSLWFFNGAKCVPITLEESNKLLKQPKPNLTVNRGEAEQLKVVMDAVESEFSGHPEPTENVEKNIQQSFLLKELYDKIIDFLETQPK